MARSTAAEIDRRIDEVRPLLPECLSLGEIRTWTIKHTSWGASVSISQLKRYLAVAREQIKEAAAIDRPTRSAPPALATSASSPRPG